MAQVTEPGIYPNIPMEEYLAMDAISNSALSGYDEQTPDSIALVMSRTHRDSKAFHYGEAVHIALLEPEKFKQTYIVEPVLDGPKTKNPWRQQWADWKEEHAVEIAEGRVLTPEEYRACASIRDSAIAQNALADVICEGQPVSELSFFWNDRETGYRCKGRMDLAGKWGKDQDGNFTWNVVVELKSSLDATPRAFARDCARYGYHRKAAFYLDGLKQIRPQKSFQFWFAVFDKRPPHPVALYQLTDESIEQGRKDYRERLDRHIAAMATDYVESYPQGPNDLELPPWAFERVEATIGGVAI